MPQLLIMKPASGGTTGLATTGKTSKGAGTTTPGSSVSAAGPAAGAGANAPSECPPGQTIEQAALPGGAAGDSEDEDDFGGISDGDGCI